VTPSGISEHDDKRMAEGFKLGGHDHVDQQGGKGERRRLDLVTPPLHLLVRAAELQEITRAAADSESPRSALDILDDAPQVAAGDVRQ